MEPEIRSKQHLDLAFSYYEKTEEFDKALIECDAALELDPDLVEAHNLRGILLEELDRPLEAIKAYKQAIQLDPSFTEAKDNLSELKSDLTMGGRLVTIARFSFPTEATLFKSKLEAEGIRAFIGGVDNVAITSGGKLQVREEDVEKALEVLNQESDFTEWQDEDKENPREIETDVSGEGQQYLEQAFNFYDRDEFEKALEPCNQAIQVDPSLADAHNLRGVILEELGRKEEAILAYREAIRLDPKFDEAKENLREIETEVPPEQKDVVEMYKSFRSWAIGSLLLGGLSIFTQGMLDPVWGIVLLVLAILSWRIKIPAMFVLYGVIMAWAAVMNGLSLLVGTSVGWSVLALVQIFWVVSILRQYRKYSHLSLQELFESGSWPASLAPPQREDIVTSRFAIAGIILAVSALILGPSLFIGTIILMVITKQSQMPSLMIGLISGTIDVAVLALGFSCAALLSKNNKRGWAIGGVVVSALVLIGWLFLIILFFSFR